MKYGAPRGSKKGSLVHLAPATPCVRNQFGGGCRALKVLENGWPSLTGGGKGQHIHRPVEKLAPRCSEFQQPEEAGADDVPPPRACSRAPEGIPTQEGRLQGCAVCLEDHAHLSPRVHLLLSLCLLPNVLVLAFLGLAYQPARMSAQVLEEIDGVKQIRKLALCGSQCLMSFPGFQTFTHTVWSRSPPMGLFP